MVVGGEDTTAGGDDSGAPVGRLDELALLLADTPLRRLRVREKDAQRLFEVRGGAAGGRQTSHTASHTHFLHTHHDIAIIYSYQAGDLWGSLKFRQEALALCKLYSPSGPYASENNFPMLLSDTHFKLAKVYAALQCIAQASDHCNK